MIKILSYMIFYPMLWFRGISRVLLGILGSLFFIGAIILTFAKEFFCMDTIMFIIFGLITFTVREIYDSILLKVKPEDMDLFLFK